MMMPDKPRLIFWELTKKCNLFCKHCRAEAENQDYPGELSLEKIKKVIDDILEVSSPILVLTGGEPLLQKNIFQIIEYAVKKDIRVALATNGTLIDEKIAKRIKDLGVARVAISIDGKDAESHDGFRGEKGSFDKALNGVDLLKKQGVEFQFNTTITKRNVDEKEDIINLAIEKGATALHLFMLVPVGCGVEIADEEMLSSVKYEETLNWFYHRSKDIELEFKATCAPHYYRIIRERAKEEDRKLTFEQDGMAAMTRGCLAGSGVCFISNTGEVQPCGYLPISAGNVTKTPFKDIWNDSELFKSLRDVNLLEGKCGICAYKMVCGGCRARAFYESGNYQDEEPFCVYEPAEQKK